MDRKMVLAIALLLIVAILPSLLSPRKTPAPGAAADSAAQRQESTAVAESGATTPASSGAARPAPTVSAPTPAKTTPRNAAPAGASPSDSGPARVVTVTSGLYRYRFSTRGARLVGANLRNYKSFAPGDTGAAQIVPDNSEWLDYTAVVGADTLNLHDWSFTPDADSVTVSGGTTALHWRGERAGRTVELTYTFQPDRYLFDVAGAISNAGSSGVLLDIGVGPRLRSIDADTVADIRGYGVVTKAQSTENLSFHSMDPGERKDLDGPFEWVAIKSKYFVGAVLSLAEDTPRFGGAVAIGGAKDSTQKYETRVHVTTSLPAPGGKFAFSVFMGPQEYRVLSRIGHDFGDVNPYGWIFRPIIRPVAQFVVQILLWMHEHLSIGYGWVLIVFGLAVRILLWPLNQKAMRSSMAMQAIQPEMKALQDRYKNDSKKLQEEMMKLYRENNVNPLGGCLPMLIPMPILFALFFVFANTIEFRGVPFLWLPDLSRADPYFIIPIIMGLSMFAVSKIGQMGVPPNPQAKMMTYVMPPVMTFLFLRFSAGLNLYYAVSNIASVPQQWMIAQERLRRKAKRASAPPPDSGGKPRKR